jgi:hypothetical protein
LFNDNIRQDFPCRSDYSSASVICGRFESKNTEFLGKRPSRAPCHSKFRTSVIKFHTSLRALDPACPNITMMWNPSHLHSPRRSHEQSHIDLKTSRSSSPDDGSEPRRRTSSDATPRQTPASTRFLNASSDQDTSRNLLPSTLIDKPEISGSSRRLGFFADKLTSSLSGTAKDTSASLKNSLHPSLLLHPHSHTRAESGSTTSSVLSPGAMSTSSNLPTPKSHTSPSKVSFLGQLDSFWNHL